MNRRWATYPILGGIAVAGCVSLPLGLPRGVLYAAIALSGAVAIAVGVAWHRPERRLPWLVLAAGQLCTGIGESLFVWYEDVLETDPFPSAADGWFLAAYPVMAMSLGAFAWLRQRDLDVAALVDSAIVTVSAALIAWVVVAAPVVAADDSLSVTLVGVAYPLADVVLLAFLMLLITARGARTASFRLQAGAVLLLLAADGYFAVLEAAGADGHRADVLFLASYVAWGTAALHPSMRTLTERGREDVPLFSDRRLVALTVAVLLAPIVLTVQMLTGRTPSGWAVAVSSMALFLLVVARMRLAIRAFDRTARERDRMDGDLRHQAMHDPLTGLANRAYVLELIEAALHRGLRAGTTTGLLLVDLDRFRSVNDTHGRDQGDVVLRATAHRLRDAVRAGDTVGRLASDEFVVLTEGLAAETDVVELARRLQPLLAAPVDCDDEPVRLSASIGVALDVDGGTRASRLLHEADVARQRSKAGGRGRIEVFDDALRRELDERVEVEAGLVRAIAEGELELHYQPVVATASGRLEGFEALVRWNRAGEGLVPPDRFIPVAERSGLICDLDRWVLGEATRQLAAWTAEDPERFGDLTVAVNVSGRHLSDPVLLDDVRAALAASGLDASRLVLEITETVLVAVPVASARLAALGDLGVQVSIDDFGTGYTSIGQLQHLPVDTLKIDREFVGATSSGAYELISLLVTAAQGFGLRVVAEGVETQDQLDLLRRLSCESAQGYFLGRPCRADQVNPPGEVASDRRPA